MTPSIGLSDGLHSTISKLLLELAPSRINPVIAYFAYSPYMG